jgi:cyclophilin family peptidyl-prolyl cis-trans isomerase
MARATIRRARRLVLHRDRQRAVAHAYTVFGRVVDGLAVVDAIEQSPVNGEMPVTRIDLVKVRIVRP